VGKGAWARSSQCTKQAENFLPSVLIFLCSEAARLRERGSVKWENGKSAEQWGKNAMPHCQSIGQEVGFNPATMGQLYGPTKVDSNCDCD